MGVDHYHSQLVHFFREQENLVQHQSNNILIYIQSICLYVIMIIGNNIFKHLLICHISLKVFLLFILVEKNVVTALDPHHMLR